MFGRIFFYLFYSFPWIIMFVAVHGLVHFGQQTWYGLASSDWPATDGEVQESYLIGKTYEVQYKYTVDNKEYTNNVVAFDAGGSGNRRGNQTTEREDEVMENYSEGQVVKVYYDPSDPGSSVLEPGFHSRSLLQLIWPALWFGFGFGLRRLIGPRPSREQLEAEANLEEEWADKERACPECDTKFTSIQNKGVCPKCQHKFYASHAHNPDDYSF